MLISDVLLQQLFWFGVHIVLNVANMKNVDLELGQCEVALREIPPESDSGPHEHRKESGINQN